MKKIFYFMFALGLAFTLNACASEDDDNPGDTPGETPELPTDLKALVVYYTRSGNTETVANTLHELVGGDIIKIETVVPYPADYNSVLAEVREELNNGTLREISTVVENIDQYDIIFIGHPIWHSHVPPAAQTFVANHQFAGKLIAPFCTHGGSGIAQSRADITRHAPQATLTESLAINGSSASNSRHTLISWLERIGVTLTSE